MSIITHFNHPASPEAPEMFVLRAEADLLGWVLQDKVGDRDMFESAELAFSLGMNPQYHTQIRLVASDATGPSCEADVLAVATVDLPMTDNPRLANVSVVVRHDRRGEEISTALHAAALAVAAQHGRTTIQAWTWEPLRIPDGRGELLAETGIGAVDADSHESLFLTGHGYVLAQFERISRLTLPHPDHLAAQLVEAMSRKPSEYEVITLRGTTPGPLLDDAAGLRAAMAADAPSGALDVEDEKWDAERVRASELQVETANRDQLQTLVRHVQSDRIVGFTRLVRDRAHPGIAHQWETLVLAGHRGHGLGMLMKVANHAAVAESWPQVERLVTGNALENGHMLAINVALGYEPYAANGFWEMRRGTVG